MKFEHRHGDVLVRPLAPEDAASLHRAVRDSIDSLSYWLPWCREDYSLADATDWIRCAIASWEAGSAFPLGVFDRGGAVIGGTGISDLDRAEGVGNIGYWTCESARNRGVATTAARASALLGFGKLGLARLEIVVLAQNLASRRVAEKLGALREAEVHDRLRFRDQPAAAVVYSLVPVDIMVV